MRYPRYLRLSESRRKAPRAPAFRKLPPSFRKQEASARRRSLRHRLSVFANRFPLLSVTFGRGRGAFWCFPKARSGAADFPVASESRPASFRRLPKVREVGRLRCVAKRAHRPTSESSRKARARSLSESPRCLSESRPGGVCFLRLSERPRYLGYRRVRLSGTFGTLSALVTLTVTP